MCLKSNSMEYLNHKYQKEVKTNFEQNQPTLKTTVAKLPIEPKSLEMRSMINIRSWMSDMLEEFKTDDKDVLENLKKKLAIYTT